MLSAVRVARAAAVNAYSCLAVCICMACAGCAVHAPALSTISHRLIVAAVEQGREERLSVYAAISDQDGIADISRIVIIHDDTELYWELDSSSWSMKEEGSRYFIGSNGLSAPPSSAMPRGSYRVLVYDLAGERAEGSFRLAAPDSAAYALPQLVLAGGDAISVASPYLINSALFYDAGGNVTKTAPLKEGRTALDALWEQGLWRSGADYLAVYSFDPKSELGLISWKIRLPD
jgi:hypothetical protein